MIQRLGRTIFIVLFATLFAVAGCTAPGTAEPGAGESVASPTIPPTETAEAVEATEPAATPDEEPATAEPEPTTPPETTPTTAPDPTPETSDAPLAGLVYQTAEGLWQIGADGEPTQRSSRQEINLSPDGVQGLYIEEGDVWIVDLPDGEPQNVTAGSEREHVHAQWWPARPQTLILASWDAGDEGPNAGQLTLVETDGSDYRVVNPDGELSNAFPAPSPDGEAIAYDEAGQAMIYHIDDGVSAFDPYAYGLPEEVEVWRIGSPAWSPDGTQLAWVAGLLGGGFGSDGTADGVVAVFDLQAQTVQLLHPFAPIGRGGWFQAPLWSPDGQWLTFLVESQDQSEYGLWAMAAGGSAEQQLNQGAPAQAWWAPSGEQRLLLAVPRDGDSNYALLSPPTWEETAVTLPKDALVREWRELP